jgi:hypothetical protein
MIILAISDFVAGMMLGGAIGFCLGAAVLLLGYWSNHS